MLNVNSRNRFSGQNLHFKVALAFCTVKLQHFVKLL